MLSAEIKPDRQQLKLPFSLMHFANAHHYNSSIPQQISMADIAVYQPKKPFKNVDLIIKAHSVHSNSGAKPNLTGFTTLIRRE